MFDTFLYAFNAVTPMLLLMLLGWGLKAAHFFDDELLRKLFWIIMPRRSRRSVKIWASTQPSPVSTRQVASTNQMLSR